MSESSTCQTSVEIRNVSKSFGSVCAVKNISFSFTSGQVHGFIGPNGAGKTTTMRIIASLEEACQGDVFVNGVSVIDYPDKTRQLLGFMPDYIDSYKNMTTADYLDFYARAYKLRPKQRTQRLGDVIEFCRLGEWLDRPINGLSKGMKQRLSLGRVLINDPQALVLDEPAAGLDPHARIELRKLIRLLADRGKAVLISSHILSELSEVCDAVTIIDQGSLRKTGDIATIHAEIAHGASVIINLADRDKKQLERLAGRLTELSDVQKVTRRPNGVDVLCSPGASSRAAMLKTLIDDGYEISDFHLRQSDLEDAFVQLTGPTGRGE